MTVQSPAWPKTTGSSLLLVPLAYRDEDWSRAQQVVQAAIEDLGVAVARGLSHCPSYVTAGAEALLGASGNDVLVFRCPADVALCEAAPLVTAAESGIMSRDVATFFRKATEAGLQLAAKVAWVVAHDWSAGDRVRWDSGDIDRLVQFATSPGAWRTPFLVTAGHVSESDEWPYWFEVARRDAETGTE